MDTRPPGFSRSDFTPTAFERRLIKSNLSAALVAEPLFPRWLLRLIVFYIAAHTIVGLALLIALFLTIIRFLPLIQRISELAGVY